MILFPEVQSAGTKKNEIFS